ncbi:MAG TPA: sigma 54-interacting transcriptional regulator, partial [Polyangiaceae bacterium]|jgi:transcriptional regulator with PAS, ATPase and Fis domain|nr:sigma 54-interacting transcriptional regulator [Polyangiaceae bacterium]
VLLYAGEYAALPAAWPLREPTTVIGREAGADIVLAVSAVSRRHAEVTRVGDDYLVRDLGSRNGTLVNGHPVSETVLEPLDELRIGDAILKLVEEGIDDYAAFRIDGAMVGPARRRAPASPALVGGLQMDRILGELHRVARAPLNVLLLGASGTGKEVVASELHRLSGRTGRFAAVNCAAIPGNLLESELFGYKRGAFSGADRDKPGLIRAADGGTLLLDEIGDMPLEAQAKLLRVLQAREVLPLGATAPETVDVRVVGATHRDLGRLQLDGKFREDLFARLNEYKLSLPALYERKEDVFNLLTSFLARQGRSDLKPSFPYMTALIHHDWPYNVRELEACIKRSVALADGHVLLPEHLPEAVTEAMEGYGQAGSHPGAPSRLPSAGAGAPGEEELRELLRAHAGNVAAVGRVLGKARMQIHRWMKRYSIEIEEYRG